MKNSLFQNFAIIKNLWQKYFLFALLLLLSIGDLVLDCQDSITKPNFLLTITRGNGDTIHLTVRNLGETTVYIPPLGTTNNYITITRPTGRQRASRFIDPRHGIELTDENTLSPSEQHTFTRDARFKIFGFIPQREEDRGVFKLQWTFYDAKSEVIELEFW
ncbi:MAG: hypothetical protein AAGF87_02535 [Bacteroidota bacterium]